MNCAMAVILRHFTERMVRLYTARSSKVISNITSAEESMASTVHTGHEK